MPFALVTFGLILIVTGAKGSYASMGKQLQSDFTGEGNFTYWIASIGGVGALGYIDELKAFSKAFMALIIIAMVIRNGGVFDKLTQALKTGPIASAKRLLPTGALDITHETKGATASDPISQGANALGAPNWLTSKDNFLNDFAKFIGAAAPDPNKLPPGQLFKGYDQIN